MLAKGSDDDGGAANGGFDGARGCDSAANGSDDDDGAENGGFDAARGANGSTPGGEAAAKGSTPGFDGVRAAANDGAGVPAWGMPNGSVVDGLFCVRPLKGSLATPAVAPGTGVGVPSAPAENTWLHLLQRIRTGPAASFSSGTLKRVWHCSQVMITTGAA
jgi:hypothetical protein